MSSTNSKRTAFYVDQTMWTPRGYIPALVTEDEPGFAPMIGSGEHASPWYWGTDLATAKKIARDANEQRGISDQDATDIVNSSIAAQIRDDAAREANERRWQQLREGR